MDLPACRQRRNPSRPDPHRRLPEAERERPKPGCHEPTRRAAEQRRGEEWHSEPERSARAGPPSGRFTGRASCGASACASRCTCGTRTVEARVLPRVSSRRGCGARGLRPRPRGGLRGQGAPGGLPDLVVRAHADPVGDRAVLLHLLRQRHLHLEPLVRRHVSCERRGREAGRVGRCEAAPKAVRNVQSGRLGWERWLPRSCSMCSPRAL